MPASNSRSLRRHLFRCTPGSAKARIVVLASTLVMVCAGGCAHGTSGSIRSAASSPASFPPSPSASFPTSPPGAAKCSGTVLDHRDIKHPDLGAVRVFLVRRPDSRITTGCIAAVTGNGRTLASINVDIYENDLHFAAPLSDATKNTFVIYNPGRYNGVLVLVPDQDGFEDVGWISPKEEHYSGGRLVYYNARLVGPGEDGRYTIIQSSNSCNPSCADGAIAKITLYWNGHEYLPTA